MTTPTTTVVAQGGLTTASAQERWRGALMDNYGTPPIALVRGRGARVWDVEDREYVDLLAGIAVNALGHAHPDVVAAITAQASTIGHTSNLAMTLPAIALAERLVSLLDPSGERGGRVFFCNSGAEANEAAFTQAPGAAPEWQGEPLRGRLMIHDALYAETRVIGVKKRPDCPVCGSGV